MHDDGTGQVLQKIVARGRGEALDGAAEPVVAATLAGVLGGEVGDLANVGVAADAALRVGAGEVRHGLGDHVGSDGRAAATVTRARPDEVAVRVEAVYDGADAGSGA